MADLRLNNNSFTISDTNKFLGVNEDSPAAFLHITQDVANWTQRLENTSTGGGTWYVGSTDDSWALGEGGAFVVTNTGSSSSPTMVLDSSRLAYFGDPTPSEYTGKGTLNVGSDSTSAFISVKNSSREWNLYNNGSNNFFGLYDRTGGVYRFLVHTNGEISTNGETAPDVVAGGLCLNEQAQTGKILTFKSSGVNHGMTGIAETDTYGFFQEFTDDAGDLGINGLGETQTGIFMTGYGSTTDSSTSTGSVGPIILRGARKSGSGAASLGSANLMTVMDYFFTSRYIFKGNGAAYADATWTTFSDERLKTDRVPLTYGLAEIKQLNPEKYQRHSGHFDEQGDVVFDGDPWDSIGLMAQDVLSVVPEAVPENADPSESFYGLTYSKLVPVLINAVKELSDKCDDYEARITALESA